MIVELPRRATDLNEPWPGPGLALTCDVAAALPILLASQIRVGKGVG